MFQIDLTPIFQAVIALLAALVTYKLIPWIKTKTTEQDRANLAATAKIVVFAAEQIYGAGHGEEKLDYAIAALEKAGYSLEKDIVREAIENAVAGMNWDEFIIGAALEDEESEAEQEDSSAVEIEETENAD